MLIPRYSLPRMIEVGTAVTQAQSLDLDIYDDEAAEASAQKTPSAGTVTLYDGSTVLVSAASVTPGAPSTYSLAAASVTSQALSEQGLEVWSLTVAGVATTFQRPAMFVRRVYRPVITDADLTDGRHHKLDDIRPDDLTSWAKYRREGDTWIQRSLISKGRRPWLIFDAWELREAHILYTLGLIFRDAHARIGDGRYKELEGLYLGVDGAPGLAQKAMEAAAFRYDGLESGTIDRKAQETPNPAVVLTAGPARRGYDALSLRQSYPGGGRCGRR